MRFEYFNSTINKNNIKYYQTKYNNIDIFDTWNHNLIHIYQNLQIFEKLTKCNFSTSFSNFNTKIIFIKKEKTKN